MTREQVQREGKEAFFNSDGKATLIIGTGGGKSKVAVEIAKELDPPQILFLSNSERGRDVTFRDEFIKWGAQELWDSKVVAECYQTAYKWKDMYFPLVIADEVDFAMTDEFSKFFFNNKYDKLVGLTGFITEEKRSLLNTIAPIRYEISTQRLQELGVLNKTQFIKVEFDLERVQKTVKVEYKKNNQMHHFFQTENDAYVYQQGRYVKALSEMRTADNNIEKLSLVPHEEVDMLKLVKEKKSAFHRMKHAASARKKLLWTLESSKSVARKIIAKEVSEGNKLLVFSKLTDHIDSLCTNTYHSKNSKDNTNINKLNRGEIKVLGVCESINRAENLDGVSVLLQESYDGSETAFQQKHGRGTRLGVDNVMKYYILIPYYYNPVYAKDSRTPQYVRLPTQAAQWAEAMTAQFDMSNTITLNENEI